MTSTGFVLSFDKFRAAFRHPDLHCVHWKRNALRRAARGIFQRKTTVCTLLSAPAVKSAGTRQEALRGVAVRIFLRAARPQQSACRSHSRCSPVDHLHSTGLRHRRHLIVFRLCRDRRSRRRRGACLCRGCRSWRHRRTWLCGSCRARRRRRHRHAILPDHPRLGVVLSATRSRSSALPAPALPQAAYLQAVSPRSPAPPLPPACRRRPFESRRTCLRWLRNRNQRNVNPRNLLHLCNFRRIVGGRSCDRVAGLRIGRHRYRNGLHLRRPGARFSTGAG